MKANLLNDLSNVVKKGTGLACSWSQVGRMSEGGAIEHPLSTHSAPFGIRWKPAGEKGSTRVWKHVAMIFAVLILSVANIGMAWGQTTIYNTGWEGGIGTWSGNLTITEETTNVRTGSKAIKGSYTGSSSAKNASQATGTTTTSSKSVYCHIIGWAKSANGTMKAQIGFTSSKKGSAVTLSTSSWTQIKYVGNEINASTIILYKQGNGSSDKYDVYFDDVVSYYSSSSTTDVTAPSAATSASATTSSISWTNGSDSGTGATGRQTTSIWRRTSGSSDDLTLNAQGIYAMSATDQSGHWTCVSATVAKGTDAATSSYEGTFSGGDRYAIVHRDLAYNYSTPTYVTVPAAAGSTWYVKGGWNSWGTTDNLTGSGTELSATVNITTAGLYEFKIWNSDGDTWYGNTGNIGCNVSGWTFSTGESANCKFFASETGNYTFTFNTSTKALSVTYPTAQGKYYYKNTGSWGTVAVYRYVGGINNGWPGTQVVETETICGDTYYFTYADPGTTLIFNNNGGGSQTGNMAASGNAGKYVQGTESSWRTFPTYTVTYNKNGDGAGGAGSVTGSVPTDGSSPYACGSTVTVLGNTGSLVRTGYNFIGWNTAPGGGGTSYVADATFTISANTTLYAQWELIPTYDVIYNTNGGTGGSTASQTDNHTGDQVTTRANGFTRSGYKFKWWNTAANGSGEDFYPGEKVTIASANVNLYAQWEEVGADWEFWVGEPSAWHATTHDVTVGDMNVKPSNYDNSNNAINTDLTANPTKVNGTDKHAISMAVGADDYYVEISFTDGSPINSLKLWATTNQTSSKKLAIIYSTTADFSTGEYEAKEVSVPANNAASKAMTDFSPATADKYFYARIYRKVATAVYGFTGGSGNTARIYGIKAEKGHICSAPTGLSAASTTAKGTTFTVTDGDDTNNYDFYVSTSSSAPNAETSATYTSTSKTKTIDNLYAGTTFYAWVRSNCGAYGKSGWTALTGNTFTTSTVSASYTLTNVTKSSGATSGIGGSDYTAVFTANTGYSMPNPTVTIGGNAATIVTDYTWSVDGAVGTITIPANKINGNIAITLNSAKAAPSSVTVDGTWHRFPGETITLTTTVTGGNGPKTYQWYKGEDAIVGATSATYTKASCEYADAGNYWCTVTCGGTESTSSSVFQVKILRLYVKTGRNGTAYGNVDFTKVDGSTATADISLGLNWDYGFNIADGCGHYYGNTGSMSESDCTGWSMNVDGTDCLMRTTNSATYTFTVDYTNIAAPVVSITYPTGDQAADKIIYFDNQTVNWSTLHYRIGRSDHTQATAMTKVPGTNNLYQVTTAAYNTFSGWHIANNAGWTGSNSIYRTYTNGDQYSITYATAHEGGAVTQAAVTVTPTTWKDKGGDAGINDNCDFYNYSITSGMKTQNVAISPYSNGTITVNYTNTSDVASTLTSGNADLAHSVILTSITAVPNTGYDAGAITINGGAYSANYVVTGSTTIAATFSLHNYNVTYSAPGNGNNYTIKVADGSATSASKTATMGQTITIVASPATGYDFTGWTITKAGGGTVEPVNASATTTTFTMPTDDVTITASFTLKTYTVNFAASPAGYGSVSPTSIASVSHGSTVSIASNVLTLKGTNVTATPTAAGADYTYAFSGWSVSNGAAITESQTITANFTRTANQYSVTHSLTNMTTGSGATGANAATYGTDYTATLNANSGYSRPASITVTAGATDITANCTWNQSTGAVTIPGAYITGNITITAAAVLVYTVSFNSNGGSAVSPISQATTGAAITMPSAPTYADHTFQGWVIGGTTYAAGASYTPTANVTAYALWRADCAGGGGGGSTTIISIALSGSNGATQTVTGSIGGSASVNLLSSSSPYKLNNNGAYVSATLTSGNYYQSGDVVTISGADKVHLLYAGTPGSGTYLGYSSAVSSSTVTYTLPASLPSNTSTIYVYRPSSNPPGFDGTPNGKLSGLSVTRSGGGGGTCYYVTYDGNGAESGSISDATAYASGADVTVLGNTGGNAFTKAGYEFTGWNTLANGTGTPYSAGGTISGISGNVTLFAQWGAPCSDPDAPTGLAVGSITSSGATFTITDAANTNNYEIVCKTTSGTPAADATPTQTGTSKTIAVTGLNAYTDYYAYVRAVCNASHKSSWVALTGAPFKTLCEDPTTAFANGEYTIGGSALDLRTLISGNNSSGAITYSVTNAGGTGATIAGDGYSFSATIPGTASVRASQAANGGHCAVVLDATVTVAAANTCVTIAYFETSQHDKSNNKPDSQAKYLYGYDNSAKTSEYAYTLTTGSTDNKGQGTGASDYLRMNYGTTVNIYADNTTTGGTPASWSDVTSVSVDFKMKNSSYYTTFDIKVGNTTIADNVSLQGDAQTGFTTFTYNNLANLDGKISIINNGSGSSNYHFYVDNIRICTSSLTPCTTPTIPTLSNQTVCPGSDIAAWDATVSNAAAISAAGESVAYSWKKKGSDTELVNTASLDLGSSATEGQSGTYVVTVTVSADGKASASASKEVTLTVTPATEEPAVTQSPAKVYVSDDVTLTATCGSAGTITWAWYTCNSDGTGESVIAGKTTATCAITAPAVAGTYYYKVKATGDGTNACGTAEHIHALVVTAASECENYFWFTYADDATTNGVINNRSSFFTGAPTGSSNQGSYKFTVDGTEYTATRNTGSSSISISFTVPEGSTADFVMNGKSSSSNTVTLSHSGGVLSYDICASGSYAAYSQTGLTAGTWTLTAGSNWTLAALAVHVCHASSCTDAVPEIAAVNNTVCSGTELSITATGYEDGATFQWQKLNSGTSSWDNISGATSATYTVAYAAAANAGSYRLIATKGCARTSNTVTIAVPSEPNFGSTVPASVTVMQTIALSISTVEATDAVKYRWYKSADATWDAGDAEIGTDKNLIKAYAGEAIGSPSYYIFCRAQNSCGITTSSAIAINVIAYVEEDCATRGNEGEAQFGFDNGGCGQASYSETACWTTSTRAKYLTYTAPEGKYLKTAKVTVAVSSGSKCGYAYSTDGGTTWTYAELTSLSSTLTEKTINLNSLSGTINAFRIGRNLQDGSSTDWGVTSGNFYLSKACFEYTNACTATAITPSTASVNYEMGGAWSNPTFSLTPAAVSGETLTYTSSNEDIATVDDEGTVSFTGDAGTVVITASYAGGTVAAVDYCASEGSYTINVSCPGGAPKVVADGSVDMSGCNSSVTLLAKKQDGSTDFTGGSYQWLRNGEEISGATSKSYTATQAGIYTVEYTNGSGCTTPSTNSATVTSETTEPEVERLVPFQYYHVDKTYTDYMKMRHLFAVKNSGKLDGKSFKLYVSRNGGDPTDVTNSNALAIWTNADGRVDTVMVDLNKLSGKYSEDDELVYTCKAIDCEGNVSETYKATITMHVIDETPTLALICSGADGDGTRETKKMKVGGDFLTGYNKADLCQQTGKTSFDASQEWGLYTELKAEYLVTPVNGYANFYKLNYEPFDLLFLTDYPKASKSDAAATVLDDMAELVDFRPFFSFKTHMVHKSPSKWAAKGFTTSPTENKADGRLYLNIVCYAHPMFTDIKSGDDFYNDADDASQLVYKMLSGTGYENSKGMQGFEIDAAENFVTIGLTHYNGTAAPNYPETGKLKWTPASGDRMLVSAAERQANLEARMILFSLNAGAHSKLTDKGELVVLKCLEYLISDAADPLTPVADCSLTFDDATGDGKWSTPGNWGPNHINIPGEFNSARIAAPVTVDIADARALELRIIESGHITIPAGSALQVTSTVRRMDGHEISPTEVADLSIGSTIDGNGTLILNNNAGDTKAGVAMYSKGFIDGSGNKNYQYMGTPFNEVNALYNYYGSWIYSWSDKGSGYGWKKVPNGGTMYAWTGYCITQETATTHWSTGTLAATGTVDITVPADENMVVGNSWTAPISIGAFADDDFENLLGNVYFFNAGVDKDYTSGHTETADKYAPSTYVTVPIHAADYTGTSDHIPSLQGFFVKSNGSAGTLHLDYDRHVRGTTRDNILSGPMHAPKRAQATDTDEPVVLKIKVSGENYDDKLLLLAREDFSMGFDNGWDGDKWDGNESALYIYTKDEAGTENSVSAIPEMEGTVIGFRAGEDDAYTLHFEYLNSAEELYLFDTETNAYTKIMTGATYRFFTDDKEKHDRFVITRKSPQIATDVDEVDSGKRRDVRKLLIEDKMYILLNGMLYDATGKVVK